MREKDVELAFAKWVNSFPDQRVCGRQVHLPFGILDVLYLRAHRGDCCTPVIAEIKAGVVDEKALTQVMGYCYQLDYLLSAHVKALEPFTENAAVRCRPMLVGTHMRPMVRRVAQSFGVSFVAYSLRDEQIVFELDDSGYGLELVDHEPNQTALKLAGAITAWRADHRRRNVSHLGTYEDYQYTATGKYEAPIEGVAGTIPIWKSRQALSKPPLPPRRSEVNDLSCPTLIWLRSSATSRAK